MASQALYRKWRSQTFAELVGQEHVVQTLKNAIHTGRIGHAYLFTGPRGVGKTTMARLLAKAVNCEAPVGERPCDQCDMCRSIAEGRCVDVIEMDAASHTSVEDAREIIERVQFLPSTARTKVYVIDETHMLSTAAFNALLKTLEEPPAHALFILATTEFHKVPATIISRCQRFVFTRHSIANIASHLEHIAHEESITLEAGVAERIARAATGAMRDAISILDQLIAGCDGTVTLAQVQGLLGASDTSNVGALVNALMAADVQAALQVVNQVADNGADLRQFARDLVERLRALMLLSAGGDAVLDVPAETLQEMQAQAAQSSVGQLVAWLKLFSNLDFQLKNSPYGQLPLELAVVEALVAPVTLLAAPATPPIRPVVTAQPAKAPQNSPPRRTEPAVPSSAAPQPSAGNGHRPTSDGNTAPLLEATSVLEPSAADVLPPLEPEAPRPVTPQRLPEPTQTPEEVIEVVDNAAFFLEDVVAQWEQIKEDVKADNPVVYALLEGVTPINVEDRTIVLLAKHEWQPKRLTATREQRIVERALTQVLGSQCFFRVTLDRQEEMPDINKQIQHLRKDELVRKALNVFNATIVAIEKPE